MVRNPTIDLDVRLGQLVKYVDALPAGAETTIGIPDGHVPVCVYYENLFGLLYRTEVAEAGNCFKMTGRKVWSWNRPPRDIRSHRPAHRWRRGD